MKILEFDKFDKISCEHHLKERLARFRTVPLNLNLIKNVGNIVVFLALEVFNSDNFLQWHLQKNLHGNLIH